MPHTQPSQQNLLAAALLAVAPTTGIADDLVTLTGTANIQGGTDRVSDSMRATLAVLSARHGGPTWALREAENPRCAPAVLTELANHPDPPVRRAVAGNRSTPRHVVERLHRQMLSDGQLEYAVATIPAIGPTRWLADALATGGKITRRVARGLAEHVADPAFAGDADALVAAAVASGDCWELRRQLGRRAATVAHITLPKPAELGEGDLSGFVDGMLLETEPWTDTAAAWFAPAAALVDPDRYTHAHPTGVRRSVSSSQLAALIETPSPLGHLVLLSAEDCSRYLTDDRIAVIVEMLTPAVAVELLIRAPEACTPAQLERLLATTRLEADGCRQIMMLPQAEFLGEATIAALMSRAATPVWAAWLCGHLPARPSIAVVASAVLAAGRALEQDCSEEYARAAVLSRVAVSVMDCAGPGPLPEGTLEFLTWLDDDLLFHARGKLAAARALGWWMQRELGTDPAAWNAVVTLSDTMIGCSLEELAVAVRALLQQDDPS